MHANHGRDCTSTHLPGSRDRAVVVRLRATVLRATILRAARIVRPSVERLLALARGRRVGRAALLDDDADRDRRNQRNEHHAADDGARDRDRGRVAAFATVVGRRHRGSAGRARCRASGRGRGRGVRWVWVVPCRGRWRAWHRGRSG